ncbi:MAG: hypothetical protein AAF960_22920 [Bacteroidota bacterium]
MNTTLSENLLSKIGNWFAKPKIRRINLPDFTFLENLEDISFKTIAKRNGIIIGHTDEVTTKSIIRTLRTCNDRNVFLKPIFLESLTLYEILENQVDGVFKFSQLVQIRAKSNQICAYIDHLHINPSEKDAVANCLVKTTQFLYTRNVDKLVPYPSAFSNITYAYPLINGFFPIDCNLDLAKILETGVLQQWLSKTAVDRINFGEATIEINQFSLTLAGVQFAKYGYGQPPKSLELPEGILSIEPFQEKVQQVFTEATQDTPTRFVLQLALDAKNCAFLTEKTRKNLALDCLKWLQESSDSATTFGFSPQENLWLLLPNLSEKMAIQKAEMVFKTLQYRLREVLDIPHSLFELKMFKVGEEMPMIR